MTNPHPINETESGIFDLAHGGKFNIYEPTADMIDIRDIACALSKICRFGGQIKQFYSVAQHSVIVSNLAWYYDEPKSVRQAALLHDAAEAYLFDVIKPLKQAIGKAYIGIEEKVERAIIEKFGLIDSAFVAVKHYDKLALEKEHRRFFKDGHGLIPVPWEVAEEEFLKVYKRLFV